MRESDGLANLLKDIEHHIGVPSDKSFVAERLPHDSLHGKKRSTIGKSSEFVDRRYPGMLEPRDDKAFAFEPSQQVRVGLVVFADDF